MISISPVCVFKQLSAPSSEAVSGLGEMAQWLRVARMEDWSSVPRTHTGQLTTSRYSSSQEARTLFSPLWAHTCVYSILTHIHLDKNKSKIFFVF